MSRRLEDDWEEVIPEDPTIEQLIDEILNNLMEYSYKYGAGEIPTSKNPPLIIAREAKQQIEALITEARIDENKMYVHAIETAGLHEPDAIGVKTFKNRIETLTPKENK